MLYNNILSAQSQAPSTLTSEEAIASLLNLINQRKVMTHLSFMHR
jgi:hypothetical protein